MDILGLGAVAVDDLLFLDEFPEPDSKMPDPAHGTPRRRPGRQPRWWPPGGWAGPATTPARIGDEELSRFIIAAFEAEGVSLRHLVQAARDAAVPFHILMDTID